MARSGGFKVDGLKALQKEIRKTEDVEMKKRLRLANKEAAQVVADQAKVEVPRRSGRLARSIGTQASQTSAFVKAGTAARVPYAGPIHFGWPKRNIRPQPFLYEAMDKRIGEVRKAYEKNLGKITKDLSSK